MKDYDDQYFYYENAGRVTEYMLPEGFSAHDPSIVYDEEFLSRCKVIKELDYDLFMKDYKPDAQYFPEFHKEHDKATVAQADANAIRTYVLRAKYSEFLGVPDSWLSFEELELLFNKYKDGYSKQDSRHVAEFISYKKFYTEAELQNDSYYYNFLRNWNCDYNDNADIVDSIDRLAKVSDIITDEETTISLVENIVSGIELTPELIDDINKANPNRPPISL